MASEDVFDRAAAEMASDLERIAIRDIVKQLIEDGITITTPNDFWRAAVSVLEGRKVFPKRATSLWSTGEVEHILNDSRKKGWADIPDARKYISKATRETARRQIYPDQVPDPKQQDLQRMAQQALAANESGGGEQTEEGGQDDNGEDQKDAKQGGLTMPTREKKPSS